MHASPYSKRWSLFLLPVNLVALVVEGGRNYAMPIPDSTFKRGGRLFFFSSSHLVRSQTTLMTPCC